MEIRAIAGTAVSAVGVSAKHLSTDGRPEERVAIRTLHAALDAGVTLIDTARGYGLSEEEAGHNEKLVAKALAQWHGDASDVVVVTKGGRHRTSDGSWATDARPERLRTDCDESLRALGRSAIGLYHLHRPDPQVPLAESVGALRQLQDEGKIGLLGVSHVSTEEIDEALEVADLAAVGNEMSPAHRSDAELEHCALNGLSFLCYRPLRGTEKGTVEADPDSAFADVAAERGVSPQQIALAWLLAMGPATLPLPTARDPDTILDALAGAELELVPDELARLDEEG